MFSHVQSGETPSDRNKCFRPGLFDIIHCVIWFNINEGGLFYFSQCVIKMVTVFFGLTLVKYLEIAYLYFMMLLLAQMDTRKKIQNS